MYSPAKHAREPGSSSASSSAVRNPTRPKFTPSTGHARVEAVLERAQHRPVAAEHDEQVGVAVVDDLDARGLRRALEALHGVADRLRACRA